MSTKKNRRKKYFYLAQYLQCLPFWQKARGACHFDSRAANLTEPLSWVGHPSQAKGLISSPIAPIASYCDRKASTLS
jgi:hypothetical protein